MKTKRIGTRRIWIMLIVAALVFSLLPLNALAADVPGEAPLESAGETVASGDLLMESAEGSTPPAEEPADDSESSCEQGTEAGAGNPEGDGVEETPAETEETPAAAGDAVDPDGASVQEDELRAEGNSAASTMIVMAAGPGDSWDPVTGILTVALDQPGNIYTEVSSFVPAADYGLVKTIIVTGTLGQMDFSHLAWWWKNATTIDLSGATLNDSSAMKQVYSGGRYFLQYAETIIMPKNGTWTLPNSMFYNSMSARKVKYIDLSGMTGDVANSALLGAKNLETVILPNRPIKIGDNAFSSLPNLANIDLSQVTHIGMNAFNNYQSPNNTALKSIDLSSLQSFGGTYAFAGNLGLTSVTFGPGVTNIPNNTFQNCSGLTELRFESMTAPTVDGTTFAGTFGGSFSQTGTLTYPAGATGYEQGVFGAPALNGWTFDGGEEEDGNWTVTFDFDDGQTEPVKVTVADGETVSTPAAPSRPGYKLTGWYADGIPVFISNSTPITSDVTVYARWAYTMQPTLTATPANYGLVVKGGTLVTLETSTPNADIYYSLAPSTTGYTKYEGPFTIGSFDTNNPMFGFNRMVYFYDMSGNAKSNIKTVTYYEGYKVTFEKNDGSTAETTVIKNNTAIAKPTDPQREGCTFKGWTLNGAAYDFSAKVTGNITLTAKWEATAVLAELQSLVDTLEALDAEDYTKTSWNALQDALEDAKEVLDNSDAILADIEAARGTLIDAQAGLVARGSITELGAFVKAYSTLQEDNYTADSWTSFKEALDAAKTLIANADDASVADVAAATKTLKDAANALEKKPVKVNTFALEFLIELAEETIENESDLYIPKALENLNEVIDASKALLENTALTQDMVDNQCLALADALSELLAKGDKTALKDLIDAATGLDEGQFTPGTWEKLQEALEKAQKVYGDPNALDAPIKDAYAELLDAIAGLEGRPVAVDKTALYSAIKAGQVIADHIGDYVPSSVTGFVNELNSAKAVYNNTSATQAEVDAAAKNLLKKIALARKLANKSALAAAMGVAGSLDQNLYTAASVSVLNTAYGKADIVMSDAEVTQAQVDTARVTLQDAIDNMVLLPSNDGTASNPQPEANDGTSGTPGGTGNGSGPANTGSGNTAGSGSPSGSGTAANGNGNSLSGAISAEVIQSSTQGSTTSSQSSSAASQVQPENRASGANVSGKNDVTTQIDDTQIPLTSGEINEIGKVTTANYNAVIGMCVAAAAALFFILFFAAKRRKKAEER